VYSKAPPLSLENIAVLIKIAKSIPISVTIKKTAFSKEMLFYSIRIIQFI